MNKEKIKVKDYWIINNLFIVVISISFISFLILTITLSIGNLSLDSMRLTLSAIIQSAAAIIGLLFIWVTFIKSKASSVRESLNRITEVLKIRLKEEGNVGKLAGELKKFLEDKQKNNEKIDNKYIELYRIIISMFIILEHETAFRESCIEFLKTIDDEYYIDKVKSESIEIDLNPENFLLNLEYIIFRFDIDSNIKSEEIKKIKDLYSNYSHETKTSFYDLKKEEYIMDIRNILTFLFLLGIIISGIFFLSLTSIYYCFNFLKFGFLFVIALTFITLSFLSWLFQRFLRI